MYVFAARYFFKSRYLNKCYEALVPGTTYRDAIPIFHYFEKYIEIYAPEPGKTKVTINLRQTNFKHSDYEKKVLYYIDGVLVDKGEAYRRTR
jgi:hypothetical protein